jgi:hypothetical protein
MIDCVKEMTTPNKFTQAHDASKDDDDDEEDEDFVPDGNFSIKPCSICLCRI